MGNPLKDIFTTEEPEFVSTIHFQNVESKEKFLNALHQTSETGEYEAVDGITKIDSYIKNGGYTQRLDFPGEIVQLFIGPAKEEKDLTIITDYGEYIFNFEVYHTRDSIIAETNRDSSILYVKIVLQDNSDKISMNFKLNIEKAESVEILIRNLNAAQSLIKTMSLNNSNKSIDLLKTIQESEKYWKIVSEVERLFEIHFKPQIFPKDIMQSKKIENTILGLYLLFIEKRMIKRNVFKTLTIKLSKSDIVFVPEIGQKMAFSYVDTIQQEIYEASVEFYMQNFIFNAIVSKIEESDNDTLKIDIVGTDTEPLILFYRAYKTEKEIDSLPDLNKINFDDARTLSEWIEELNT